MSQEPRSNSSRETKPRYRASDRIWRKGKLRVAERAVAEVIARHMNPEGVAWPGYERIAEEAGVTTKSVFNATKVLVNGDPARGLQPLYTRHRRHDERGRAKSYEYRLVNDPVALVKARNAGRQEQERLKAVLKGQAVEGIGMTVDSATQAVAEEIRKQELALQSQLINKIISELEYKKRMKPLEAQRSLLARAAGKSAREDGA